MDGFMPELPSCCTREADTRPRIKMAKEGRQPTIIAGVRLMYALHLVIVKE
jgi:hypothetical protein